jgi:cell pole-organizing protein PopZ
MGDIRNDPSMEEILASIKRIIAEDSAAAVAMSRSRRSDTRRFPAEVRTEAPSSPFLPEEEVLELTDAFEQSAPDQEPASPHPIVSEDVALASRRSLAALSAMVVTPENGDNTLDGLVREMLRPMLKDWLDKRLPDLVEAMVAKEIARITGRV